MSRLTVTPDTVLRATICCGCGFPTGDLHDSKTNVGYVYCDKCEGLSAPYSRSEAGEIGDTRPMFVQGQPPTEGHYGQPQRDDRRPMARYGGTPNAIWAARAIYIDEDGEEDSRPRCGSCDRMSFEFHQFGERVTSADGADNEDYDDAVLWADPDEIAMDADVEILCTNCGLQYGGAWETY